MMEPRHRLEENSRRGGERGRTSVRQRGTFSELTWCLFLILSGVEIVLCNRPPRFVLDGNVGSEIVVIVVVRVVIVVRVVVARVMVIVVVVMVLGCSSGNGGNGNCSGG